jgi:hypothetical protein
MTLKTTSGRHLQWDDTYRSLVSIIFFSDVRVDGHEAGVHPVVPPTLKKYYLPTSPLFR